MRSYAFYDSDNSMQRHKQVTVCVRVVHKYGEMSTLKSKRFNGIQYTCNDTQHIHRYIKHDYEYENRIFNLFSNVMHLLSTFILITMKLYIIDMHLNKFRHNCGTINQSNSRCGINQAPPLHPVRSHSFQRFYSSF